MSDSLYLGIDVSKSNLDVGTQERFLFTCTNDASGIKRIIDWCTDQQLSIVAIEATGGYERAAVAQLIAAGLPVAVVQPRCVRYFAQSLKVLAKTDKIDATVLAQFAAATNPRLHIQPSENIEKLRALRDRREQIIADRVREQGRLESCPDKEIARRIQRSIQRLLKEETALDNLINRCVQEDEELMRKHTIMTQESGVGTQTAVTILACLPELGLLDRQKIAALVGVAPYDRSSGNSNRRKRIMGGRKEIRDMLYMAAISAARFNPLMKQFYTRLKEKGKPHKVARIAIARKLLVRLNTLMKEYYLQKSY